MRAVQRKRAIPVIPHSTMKNTPCNVIQCCHNAHLVYHWVQVAAPSPPPLLPEKIRCCHSWSWRRFLFKFKSTLTQHSKLCRTWRLNVNRFISLFIIIIVIIVYGFQFAYYSLNIGALHESDNTLRTEGQKSLNIKSSGKKVKSLAAVWTSLRLRRRANLQAGNSTQSDRRG